MRFSKLKLRLIWRTEFETLAEARTAIQNYIEHYHHRPHSGLNYKTPAQVAQTWHDHRDPTTPRPRTDNSHGVQAICASGATSSCGI
jgi:transposase InsO family protein